MSDEKSSIGSSSEIRESIAEAQKEVVRIDDDLVKIKNDKEALLFTVADLRVKEKQTVERGLRTETESVRRAIAKAQEKLDDINSVLPETTAVEDHKRIQVILNEWYAGKRDWKIERARLQKAEKTLEGDPGDRRAQGEANRARAEMHATNEALDGTAREAELVLSQNTPNPAQDDGISYTAEQAEKDNELRMEARRVAKGIFGHNEEVGEMQKEMDVLVEEQTPVATLEENSEAQATGDTWQEEAVRAFEDERRKVLEEVKFLPDPETDDALLPVLTELADETIDSPQDEQAEALIGFNKTEEVRPVLNAQQIESYAKINARTREEALEGVKNAEKTVLARAQEAGIGDGLLRRTGNTWNKLPARYKVLLSVGMVASGVGAVAVGATTTAGAITAIGAGLRYVGGAGMFVMLENKIKERAEKTGVPRSEFDELRDTTVAAITSILIVGVLPNVVREYAVGHGFFQKILDFIGIGRVQLEVPATTEGHQEIHEETIALQDVTLKEEALVVQEAEAPTPQETTSVIEPEAPTTQDVVPTPEAETLMPQEIIPGDRNELAQLEAIAESVFAEDMDKLFGGSKFLWFGHTSGIDSINWRDPQVGFGGKTVTEIMNAHPSAFPADGERTFGVENYGATSKMQEYIANAREVSGITPGENERVADFIHRAAVAKLSK